uniref:Uncharacterized protein n=1 Tax=viral metagenome TaxID=1070528 RepID=A0A6M3LLN2_9ZZZZ
MKYTVYAYKDKNIRSSYVNHGVRTPEGGSFGTCDAGWSLKQAIRYQISRLPAGTNYQVEVNHKIVS